MILTNGARTAMADALNTTFATGEAVLLSTPYVGLDRTAALVSGQVLARFTLGATPFSESNGVLTLAGGPIDDLDADNAGNVATLCLLTSGDNGTAAAGANPRAFFSVGLSGATVDLSSVGGSATAPVEITIDDDSLTSGQDVRLSSLTITVPIGDANS